MTNLQAIAIIKNTLFSMENTLKYREEKHDEIKVEEYMFPEALRMVADLATTNNSINIVDGILKKEEKK